MQVGGPRFYTGNVPTEAPTAAWGEFTLEQQMSIPTSPQPTPPPTPPPTTPPTPPPTAPPTPLLGNPPTASPTPNPTPNPTPQPTLPPVSSPTVPPLPSLFLDEDGVFPEFGLVECQGDCDDDTDCGFGLICFERDLGQQSVPGCLGNADSFGDGTDDFCIKPLTDNTLVIVGDEGFPLDVYPLGLCEGDCDDDADCQDGLICDQRDGVVPVLGCIGVGGSGWDYCTTEISTEGVLNFVGDYEKDYYELLECQGDCDWDSDCDVGLVCDFRDSGDGGVVPGCVGNAESFGNGNYDFCIQRPSPDYLTILGDEGKAEENFPLPACSADCDDDEDCQAGLICFERSGNQTVPGCVGPGDEGYDYCIVP
eukprot:scaffold4914_cov108-Cylindrotheca_fusiformis.AAC.3